MRSQTLQDASDEKVGLPERRAVALLAGLALMPALIGAGLWREAVDARAGKGRVALEQAAPPVDATAADFSPNFALRPSL